MADSLSRTDMINPFGLCNCDGSLHMAGRRVRLAGVPCMLIGIEIFSHVVPKIDNSVLLPPNELGLGNDNTSSICSPNGVWAAQDV